jgi:type III pantothenate kinase
MKLLLDLGNTRIKWACRPAGAVEFSARGEALYAAQDPADLLAMIWPSAAPPEGVWLVNVTDPARTAAFEQALAQRWGCSVRHAVPQAEAFGVRCAYADPLRLGADRWAALVGARFRWPGPVCILDLGTALTADVLDEAGQHLGGVIAPGRQMLERSLLGGTARVGSQVKDLESLEQGGLGRDTDACVAWGVAHCVVGCCTQMVAAARAHLGSGMIVVLTGGDAPWAHELLPFASRIEPDLVLWGLAVMTGD